MLVNLVIIACSLLLLVYWFRYTCLLILNTKSAVREASEFPYPRRFSVETALDGGANSRAMGDIGELLARDYRLLTYLLRHTAGLEVGGLTLEHRLLMLDFRLMQLWYGLARLLFPQQARTALKEMSEIVAYFGSAVGERTAQAERSLL
jgi:hypothetical protein